MSCKMFTTLTYFLTCLDPIVTIYILGSRIIPAEAATDSTRERGSAAEGERSTASEDGEGGDRQAPRELGERGCHGPEAISHRQHNRR